MYNGEINMNSVIDHVAIVVDDLKKASEWYVDALDAVIEDKQENYYRLKVKNGIIALLSKDFASSKPHVGILCENIEDLPDGGERVEHRDGTTGVYMKDPSGNYLEFIHYNNITQNEGV